MKNPTPAPDARTHQLKLQMALQLIDETLHGDGDKDEKEVALQNYVVTLLNQNHQLWQAFVQVSSTLGLEASDSWESSVIARIKELTEERAFLRKAALQLRDKEPLAPDQAVELASYLYRA